MAVEQGSHRWRIKAQGGELRAGYRMAARLADCELELGPTWTLHARLTERDPYWLEYGPDRLVLDFPRSRHAFGAQNEITIGVVGDRVVVRGTGKPVIEAKAEAHTHG